MKKLTLAFILLVAIVLRLYIVASNPPALSWDEVSIGYNAYSILKTGRDEHGRFMPLDTFTAYGDYKPPLAIYLTVPFVAIFGLSDIAVRLPPAIFGVLTVLVVYFLVKELFPGEKYLPPMTAFLLSVSPWHINISRGGFEANIAHFFIVLGIWFVLSARKNPAKLMYMWIPFVCAVYLFNSARYFVPFIGIALCIGMYTSIRKHARQFLTGVVLALVLLAPIFPHLLSKEARLRFREVNIFTELSVIQTANIRLARENNSLLSNIFQNRRIGYARSFLMHFTDNLEPNFLFVRGDGNPKFSIQDVGQFFLIEAPFMIIGIFLALAKYPRMGLFLLFWLLASIIPAATARETPHALRILNSLPTWHIFIAIGMASVYSILSNKTVRNIFLYGMVVAYAGSIGYYLHTYYRHYPAEYSGEWQFGYREALQRVALLEKSYDQIVISEKIGRAYMYTLFYTKTDPQEFINSKQSYFDDAGFYHVTGFSKYIFGDAMVDGMNKRTLYIWNSYVLPQGVRVLDTVRLLNGEPVLTIFDKGFTN